MIFIKYIIVFFRHVIGCDSQRNTNSYVEVDFTRPSTLLRVATSAEIRKVKSFISYVRIGSSSGSAVAQVVQLLLKWFS